MLADDMRGANGFQHEFQAMIELPALRICIDHRPGVKAGAERRKDAKT
jgi:hypothetical protein